MKTIGFSKRKVLKTPYRFSVCGKNEIDNFSTEGITHILSIEDPGTPKETPAWFKGVHWQIQFHDVESFSEARAFNATAPTQEQVAEVLRCGEECLKASQAGPVHLLVHCYAGASRSTAACYALVAQAIGAGKAKEALRHVMQVRSEAFPNLLVVKHADHLLGRGGEMLRALAPLRQDFSEAVGDWFRKFSRTEPWQP